VNIETVLTGRFEGFGRQLLRLNFDLALIVAIVLFIVYIVLTETADRRYKKKQIEIARQGNVKNIRLDIGKIKALGWKTKHNTEPAIAKIVKEHGFYLYFLKYPLSC